MQEVVNVCECDLWSNNYIIIKHYQLGESGMMNIEFLPNTFGFYIYRYLHILYKINMMTMIMNW